MKNIISLTVALLCAFVTSGRAADAKALWTANCTQCHGASGKGDTAMGKKLNAADLTDSKKQASFTDAQATEAIKNGVKENGKTTMKAFGGKLSDDDIKALVAYVRTLKK
jgi:mono/diheme cytochrome c family protein